MSNLSRRLKRLEQSPAYSPRCDLCGGKGKHVVSEIDEGDPVPCVEGCPRCGALVHILVRYVSKSIERPAEQ